MIDTARPLFVGVSIVLAIVISFVALLRAFHFRGATTSGGWRKALSAVVMGAAIPAMHYTGMAAARYRAAPGNHDEYSHALSISSLGTVGIVTVTFMVLGFAVVTALLDRRFAAEIEQSHELVSLLLDSAPEAIYGADTNGVCTFCNRSFLQLLGYASPAEVLGKEVHPLIHHTKADGRLSRAGISRVGGVTYRPREDTLKDGDALAKRRNRLPGRVLVFIRSTGRGNLIGSCS